MNDEQVSPTAWATCINELVRARRSIQPVQFVPDKQVPDEVVQQLLENANWAPTHKRTEPWRFVVFSGEGRRKLAEFQAELYRQQAGPNFDEKKYQKLLHNPMRSSHVIAIGLKRHFVLPEEEEVAAVACAVQNLHLTATAYGLGGYWGSGGITYMEEAKPFFGLAPEDKLLGFFYLGYVQTEPGSNIRKPIADKVTWVTE
ncbi:nitroreductase family protein [Solirubrum puertoriconensis]|uniref:Putative NAD(P)H nitroreductase n=1 Tax=Solirubrum puertoriconensis TaxID=1751427 RepID=A0A9X0HNT0_SOLP1|nr:nitroreductase [Solirubrum puertoriconensis]KUG09349.1 nitroreductase [Solirubrum puertoriconensis]